MTFQKGDTVQLCGVAFLQLRNRDPESFQKLMDANWVGGEVVDVRDNEVLIDTGDILREPLSIETDGDKQHFALQLVRKAGEEGFVTPEDSQPVRNEAYQEWNQGPITPPVMGFPFGMGDPLQAAMVPSNISMSQWVVTQFLQLKKYGIAQDLCRVSDADAPIPDPTSSLPRSCQDDTNRNLRAVMIDLTAQEEQVYNTALGVIRNWLSPQQPQQPVPHPEVAPSPEAELSDETKNTSPGLFEGPRQEDPGEE